MGMSRRDFIKVALLGTIFGRPAELLAGKWEHAKNKHYWVDHFFRQDTVDSSRAERGIIKAKIDGKWNTYKIITLPEKFVEWNIKSRLEALKEMETGKMPSLAGPHSGMVASYGVGRLDSQFTLNNAVKGIGFVPHRNIIKERIKRMEDTFKAPMPEKLEFLQEIYKEKEKLDLTKQVSLELYSTPNFETHSFLNLMGNPVATIVFLDIPSFELRTICRVVHPEDRKAPEFEQDIVKYTNLIHSYFHGAFKKKFPALIFYVIEAFDNTPGEKDGMGRRIHFP